MIRKSTALNPLKVFYRKNRSLLVNFLKTFVFLCLCIIINFSWSFRLKKCFLPTSSLCFTSLPLECLSSDVGFNNKMLFLNFQYLFKKSSFSFKSGIVTVFNGFSCMKHPSYYGNHNKVKSFQKRSSLNFIDKNRNIYFCPNILSQKIHADFVEKFNVKLFNSQNQSFSRDHENMPNFENHTKKFESITQRKNNANNTVISNNQKDYESSAFNGRSYSKYNHLDEQNLQNFYVSKRNFLNSYQKSRTDIRRRNNENFSFIQRFIDAPIPPPPDPSSPSYDAIALCRGLPFQARESAVIEFVKPHEVSNSYPSIVFIRDELKRFKGDCYVRFKNSIERDKALQFLQGKYLWHRYIYLYEATVNEYEEYYKTGFKKYIEGQFYIHPKVVVVREDEWIPNNQIDFEDLRIGKKLQCSVMSIFRHGVHLDCGNCVGTPASPQKIVGFLHKKRLPQNIGLCYQNAKIEHTKDLVLLPGMKIYTYILNIEKDDINFYNINLTLDSSVSESKLLTKYKLESERRSKHSFTDKIDSDTLLNDENKFF